MSPPASGQPIGGGVGAEAGGEGFQPVLAPVARQRERQEKAERPRALGGEIGEVHPKRLLRDRVGRIVGEEMHARDQRVGRQHEVVAGRRLEQRGVVAKPEGRGAGERREKARDEFVFARAGRTWSWTDPDQKLILWPVERAAGLLAYLRPAVANAQRR